MKSVALLSCCFFFVFAHAQNNGQLPCSAKENAQFDFWMGDWNLTWSDSIHGTNHIEKIFGNCTLQENFNDPTTNYSGKSWTVYNPNYKIWQQTWVDNQGGYIDLTGNMKGDSMILTTAEKTVPLKLSPTGKLVSRMVFHHIKPDSFDWSWESSTNGGLSWKNSWLIHYERKK